MPALGTTAVLLAWPSSGLDRALEVLREELAEVDRAANRFHPSSEICRLNRSGGAWTRVSPLLYEALQVALRAARLSDGAVDPTVGAALEQAGYDRDFSLVRLPGPPLAAVAGAVPGWRSVQLGPLRRVRVGGGAQVDLGATAKALTADRVAARAAEAAPEGAGFLVSLGGDIATAGTCPPGGWYVRVTDDHRPAPGAPGQDVWLTGGALATSSTTVRAWQRGESRLHHIIDPSTGAPAGGPWRTVSVAAATCVDANTAATAAIVKGGAAPAWLDARGLPARLVAHDGTVTTVGGWPAAWVGPSPEPGAPCRLAQVTRAGATGSGR